MKNVLLAALITSNLLLGLPSNAQGWQPQPGVNPFGRATGYNPPAVPYGGNPYGNPYGNAYGNPYANPYNRQLIPSAGYGVNPYGYNYPAMGMPVPINGGNFGINIGNSRLNVWKAPSGYYYPWLNRPVGFGYPAPIVVIQQGQQNPTPAQPPLSTIFGDLNKFLDDSKSKGKISEADYNHLKLRASDLQKKERSFASGNGGSLQPDQEEDIRKDVDKLGQEVSYRVKS